MKENGREETRRTDGLGEQDEMGRGGERNAPEITTDSCAVCIENYLRNYRDDGPPNIRRTKPHAGRVTRPKKERRGVRADDDGSRDRQGRGDEEAEEEEAEDEGEERKGKNDREKSRKER